MATGRLAATINTTSSRGFMTFIVAIAQRKGGAGKTTLACQLASAFLLKGERVLGVDLDPQLSFSTWAAARAISLPKEKAFRIASGAAHSLAQILRGAGEDEITLIDTPPTIDPAVQRAIRAADLVVTPLQLSPLDLAASLPTAQAIGEAGRPFLFVVNRAPPRGRAADGIRAKLKRYRLPVASVEIGNRAIYADSIGQGLGVVECAPRSAAATEMRALAGEILKRRGARQAAA